MSIESYNSRPGQMARPQNDLLPPSNTDAFHSYKWCLPRLAAIQNRDLQGDTDKANAAFLRKTLDADWDRMSEPERLAAGRLAAGYRVKARSDKADPGATELPQSAV